MRCRNALKLLALHVGGDLPEHDTGKMLAHLEHCAPCKAELVRLQSARTLIEHAAKADTPNPLPADFSRRILLEVLEERVQKPSFVSGVIKNIRWKPALALGAAALAVLVAWGPVQDIINTRTGFPGMRGRTVRQSQALNPGEIVWGARIQLIGKIVGPCRLSDEIDPPDEPGIYAVLHRPDPQNRPDVFAVDYIGQSSRLSSPVGYLALYRQRDILLTRAGSKDSLFVVFYPDAGIERTGATGAEKQPGRPVRTLSHGSRRSVTMRKTILSTAALVTVLLLGCGPALSLHSLYTEEEVFLDAGIVGTWGEKEDDSWTFRNHRKVILTT